MKPLTEREEQCIQDACSSLAKKIGIKLRDWGASKDAADRCEGILADDFLEQRMEDRWNEYEENEDDCAFLKPQAD